jgi:hypothetical protein
MDGIIFEDPSKRPPRHRRSSRVPSTEERAAQDGLTDSQQQGRIQSQPHNNPDPHAIGPVIALGTPSIRSRRLFTALIRQQNPPQHLRIATTTSTSAATMTLKIMTPLLMTASLPYASSFRFPKMTDIPQTMTVMPLWMTSFHQSSKMGGRQTATRALNPYLRSSARKSRETILPPPIGGDEAIVKVRRPDLLPRLASC